MICYKDKTFCISLSCGNSQCDRKLTKQIELEAKRFGLPISQADFKGLCNEEGE